MFRKLRHQNHVRTEDDQHLQARKGLPTASLPSTSTSNFPWLQLGEANLCLNHTTNHQQSTPIKNKNEKNCFCSFVFYFVFTSKPTFPSFFFSQCPPRTATWHTLAGWYPWETSLLWRETEEEENIFLTLVSQWAWKTFIISLAFNFIYPFHSNLASKDKISTLHFLFFLVFLTHFRMNLDWFRLNGKAIPNIQIKDIFHGNIVCLIYSLKWLFHIHPISFHRLV